MIANGEYHVLKILRELPQGLYLGYEAGEDEEDDILLPNKYCPEHWALGGELQVFVYRDSEDRKIATNLEPKILLNQFAFLKVNAVESVGAFMDWGMEKDLLVPFREQRMEMEEDRWYIVYMQLDEESDRLYGSNKIEKRLNNDELELIEGEQVSIILYHQTDLGYNVIVNHQHKALLYKNEIFMDVKIGDELDAYVKNIREDNKLDVALRPSGYATTIEEDVKRILLKMRFRGGALALNDKSAPDVIYSELSMSKKAFKRAVGALYKNQKIVLTEEGIQLKETKPKPS
uniref:Protein containing RNA binding S1 domain n=1 Tax=uncultured Flavobacteriia bacterium TaxID=212695 RepID=H6RFV1_9BACT|nr:transcriptional regulator, GntR family [uncultured bacterium]CCF99912.1 protein containing RNA binding S1 domain [uncultured Flavobacteriia bacterium]